MKYPCAAAAAATFLLVTAAPGSSQTVDQNVRCLLVSNLFDNNAKEGQAKNVAAASKLFYAGRVSTLSAAQIQSAMAAQGKQLTPANAAATMSTCAQGMERALKAIQSAGQRLQKPKP